MKKFLILVLVIVASVANSVLVNALPIERIVTLSGSTVKIFADQNTRAVTVSITNIQNGDVKVSLENVQGQVFYEEAVSKTPRYSKKLMLSQLENGAYRLVVIRNFSKTVQPFAITDNGVTMNAADLKEKLLPVVHQKGNSVDVSYLSEVLTDVSVRIYDNEGKLVFEDTKPNVTQFAKRFDLTKLSGGAYVMEVRAGDETQYTALNL